MFLYNCWYVAAWHHEVSNLPTARTLLGERIVFFRAKDGSVAALQDRCAHRAAPLSRGSVVGNEIQCGYHGFRFNSSGDCTWVPGQDIIPPKARVRSFPVVEKWRWIWIWMGDPDLADESLVPDFWWNEHPDWAVMEGPYYHFKGNYQLIVDNLLDGSHVSFVHATTLGTDAVAGVPTKSNWDTLNVRTERWIIDRPAAPMYARIGGFTTNVDRWQLIDFIPPSSVVLDTGSCLTGTGAQQGTRDQGVNLIPVNTMTPETETSTHVFWSHTRNFDHQSSEMSRLIREQMTTAWTEDLVMMEAQQDSMAAAIDTSFVHIDIDTAPERARQIVRALIDKERFSKQKICVISEERSRGNLFGVTQ